MSDQTLAAVEGRVVVLGVTGSIAAYKAAEIVRLLVKAGAEVNVIMTEAATEFISPLTMETLSGRPVVTDMFARPQSWDIAHVSLADRADVVVIAPATAGTIARLAHGWADDMLATVTLTASGRNSDLVIAPAMNKSMLAHPFTQQNIDRLEQIGATIVVGSEGELACGEYGSGRMADPEDIVAAVGALFINGSVWREKTVVVTAGPTREYLDDVRFLSNPSSGKMGYAIARVLARRGADVKLVSGPVQLPVPRNVSLISVTSAEQMQKAVSSIDADAVFMAAAVADFRFASQRCGKAGKQTILQDGSLEIVPTVDILGTLGKDRGREKRPVLIGFAAVSGDMEQADAKLKRKRVDMIVANDISEPGSGFDVDTNRVTLFTGDGQEQLTLMSKDEVAKIICDRAADLL